MGTVVRELAFCLFSLSVALFSQDNCSSFLKLRLSNMMKNNNRQKLMFETQLAVKRKNELHSLTTVYHAERYRRRGKSLIYPIAGMITK